MKILPRVVIYFAKGIPKFQQLSVIKQEKLHLKTLMLF